MDECLIEMLRTFGKQAEIAKKTLATRKQDTAVESPLKRRWEQILNVATERIKYSNLSEGVSLYE